MAVRPGWTATAWDDECRACGCFVRAGWGWVLPRPQGLPGAAAVVVCCRTCALATAPLDGLADRLERLEQHPPVVDGTTYRPSPYQAVGARFLARRWGALLSDDKGLGKTCCALLGLPLLPSGEPCPVVIVCPAQVKSVWTREVRIWRPEYEVGELAGRGSWVAGPPPGKALILNYAILPRPPAPCLDCAHPEAEHTGQGCRVCLACDQFRGRLPSAAEVAEQLSISPGTVLIADEAHRAKNLSSARTRRLRYLLRGCERRWALTASPLRNHPRELWALYRVFGLAAAAWDTRKLFDRLFRRYDEFGAAPNSEEAAEIKARRARVELGRSAEDVGLELPELRYETRLVTLGADALREVEAALCEALAARRAHAELRAGDLEEADLEARRAELLLTSRTDADVLELVQAVIEARNWADIAPELSRLRRALALAKLPGAIAYAEECEVAGEPLVVFSCHVAVVETLAQRRGWASLRLGNRAETVDRFQAGELRGVAGTIQGSGEGITLHRSRLCLLVDEAYVPEANHQALKRVHRRGQNRPCLVTRLVADHPLDKFVARTLARKAALIQAATERATE